MNPETLAKIAEQIVGGLGDKKPDRTFIRKELREGMQVEKEHTPSKSMAKEIAKDHLTEFPRYYSHLKKMEDRLKKKAVYMSRSGKGSDAEHRYDYAESAEAIRGLDQDLRGRYLDHGYEEPGWRKKKFRRIKRKERQRWDADVPHDSNNSEGDVWSSENEIRN